MMALFRVEGPTMGEEKCEIYTRAIPEFLSCVQENPADWAFYTPAGVKAEFEKMKVDGIRCEIG